MKKILLLFALILSIQLLAQQQVYEIRTYELFQYSNFKNFNTYFKDYFIPIMNQHGIKDIGVFEEISEDLPRKIYVFIPFANMETYQKARAHMASNSKLQKASSVLSPQDQPIFNRYETSLYMAFDGMPKMVKGFKQDQGSWLNW